MKSINQWELNEIDLHLINLAFHEDLGIPHNDITTSILFRDKKGVSSARIISKHPDPMVVCGLPIIKTMLARLDNQCEMISDYQDGDILAPGASLLTFKGSAQTLLMIERTVLNFLQHLSAVATKTATFVNRIKHTETKVLDTRKTTPGFRHLDKYAVQCGGGVNHRMGLYDAIMIKDTHIDCLGGMASTLNNLPDDILQKYPVIIEVRDKEELSVVLQKASHKVTRVLLDNMKLPQLSECVAICKTKIQTEASGNINFDNLLSVAETGVNFVSIGQLTHTPGNVDLSMISK